MYNLTVDGNVASTHKTLGEALKARNAKVRDICIGLYRDGDIDKYAVHDWCSGLANNTDMSFYLDEGCGYYIDILAQ
jgi:hypothetical protein